MRYLALAADYDGTLAHHGKVSDSTVAALLRLKESGRKLLMVSGRELPDLAKTFDHFEIFDRIVLERPLNSQSKLLPLRHEAGRCFPPISAGGRAMLMFLPSMKRF